MLCIGAGWSTRARSPGRARRYGTLGSGGDAVTACLAWTVAGLRIFGKIRNGLLGRTICVPDFSAVGGGTVGDIFAHRYCVGSG